MKKLLYTFHRKFAIWLAIPLVLWALSGILHPMMANWFKPHIAQTFIPPSPLSAEASAGERAEASTESGEGGRKVWAI